MIAFNNHAGITCEQAESWFFFYLTDGPEIGKEQEELLLNHLLICLVCAKKYKADLLVVMLIREYYSGKEEPVASSTQPGKYSRTVDEVWEDFKRKLCDFADDDEIRRLQRWLY